MNTTSFNSDFVYPREACGPRKSERTPFERENALRERETRRRKVSWTVRRREGGTSRLSSIGVEDRVLSRSEIDSELCAAGVEPNPGPGKSRRGQSQAAPAPAAGTPRPKLEVVPAGPARGSAAHDLLRARAEDQHIDTTEPGWEARVFQPRHLTPSAYNLLTYLCRNDGRKVQGISSGGKFVCPLCHVVLERHSAKIGKHPACSMGETVRTPNPTRVEPLPGFMEDVDMQAFALGEVTLPPAGPLEKGSGELTAAAAAVPVADWHPHEKGQGDPTPAAAEGGEKPGPTSVYVPKEERKPPTPPPLPRPLADGETVHGVRRSQLKKTALGPPKKRPTPTASGRSGPKASAGVFTATATTPVAAPAPTQPSPVPQGPPPTAPPAVELASRAANIAAAVAPMCLLGKILAQKHLDAMAKAVRKSDSIWSKLARWWTGTKETVTQTVSVEKVPVSDNRIVSDRTVKRVAADMQVATVEVLAVRLKSEWVRDAIKLAYDWLASKTTVLASVAAVVAAAAPAVAVHHPLLAVAEYAAAVGLAGFSLCSGLERACRPLGWSPLSHAAIEGLWRHGLLESQLSVIKYIPHALTELLASYPEGQALPTPTTLNARFLRLACLPVSDELRSNLQNGTVMAALAVHAQPDFPVWPDVAGPSV